MNRISGDPVLEMSRVGVSFSQGLFHRPVQALDRLELRVGRGDIFGLLGPNGAGKSTALYCLLGLIRPQKGRVEMFGQKPDIGSPLYEKVSYVPEEPHYLLYLTVRETLDFYGALYRKKIPRKRVEDVLERLGLAEAADRKLAQCSKGMKQKAGLAACFLHEPELLFLDEPTRGLDPMMTKAFRDILLELNGKGTTIFINSHILSEVEMICNRVAILDKGRLVAQDDLAKLTETDFDQYTVEIDLPGQVPDYITVTHQTPQKLAGLIPKSKLNEFMAFTQQNNLSLFQCALKKTTLEDAFATLLKKAPPQ